MGTREPAPTATSGPGTVDDKQDAVQDALEHGKNKSTREPAPTATSGPGTVDEKQDAAQDALDHGKI